MTPQLKADAHREGLLTQGSDNSLGVKDEGRGLLGGRGRLFLIGVVLLLAVAYLIYAAFPGSTSYYFTVDELEANAAEVDGKTVRVKGKLAPDSFVREDGGTMATFTLIAGDESLPAAYDGVVPDLFFNEHSEIILQGSYSEGQTFHAETVSVLCPSKYQALEEVEAAA